MVKTSTKIIITLIVLVVTTTVFVFSTDVVGLLTGQNSMNASGVIADLTFGVYSDAAYTQNLTSIDWGVCYPGESSTCRVYVKNFGTVDTTFLIQPMNWDPSAASSFLELSSNYSGQVIAPGETVRIIFTLSISSDIEAISSFNFDIFILGQS